MAIQPNATPSDIVSGAFGTEVVTLDATGAGQGGDQECREVIIWVEEAKEVNFGNSAVNAASGPLLPDGVSTIPLRFPLINTNLLFFDGTTGDKVNMIWRS